MRLRDIPGVAAKLLGVYEQFNEYKKALGKLTKKKRRKRPGFHP